MRDVMWAVYMSRLTQLMQLTGVCLPSSGCQAVTGAGKGPRGHRHEQHRGRRTPRQEGGCRQAHQLQVHILPGI